MRACRPTVVAALVWLIAGATWAQEVEPVERSLITDAFTLDVAGYQLRDQLVGEAPPPGGAFSVVRATLTNRAIEEPLGLPPFEETFALSLGDRGAASLHPVSASLVDPSWGAIGLAEAESRPIQFAFAVPADGANDMALVYLGAGAPQQLVLGGAATAMPPALADVANEYASLALAAVATTDSLDGQSAPDGRQFVAVDLRVTNLRRPRGRASLARFAVLVEDGAYLYRPDALSAQKTPFVGWPEAFPVGLEAAARLVFLVPEQTGHLALQYYAPSGALTLDLTPDLTPAAPPEILSGPERGNYLELSLYGVRDIAVSRPGQRVVALDVGLRLEADRVATHLFDPQRHATLIDSSGNAYAPVDAWTRLERPLFDTELWTGQPARGEIAFAVPVGADVASTFILEAVGPDGPVSLLVPVAPAVVAEAPPPVDEPSPSAAEPPVAEAPAPTGLDGAIANAGGREAFAGAALRIIERRWQRLSEAQQLTVLGGFAITARLSPELPAAPVLRRLVLRGSDAPSARHAAAMAMADDALDGIALARVAGALDLAPQQAREILDATFAEARPNVALTVDAGGRFRLQPATASVPDAPLLARQLRELVPDLSSQAAFDLVAADVSAGLDPASTLVGVAYTNRVPASELMARTGMTREQAGQALADHLAVQGQAGSPDESARVVEAYLSGERRPPEVTVVSREPEPDPEPVEVTPAAPDEPADEPETVDQSEPAQPEPTSDTADTPSEIAVDTPDEPIAVVVDKQPPHPRDEQNGDGEEVALATPEPAPDSPRLPEFPLIPPDAPVDVQPPSEPSPLPPVAALPTPVPQPTPAPQPAPAEATQQAKIDALLREAAVFQEAKQLTTPEGESAYDRYRAVLALDGTNQAALGGLAEISRTYKGWGRANLSHGENTKAATYFARAVSVAGDDVAAHGLLGLAHQRAGNLTGAETAYRAALAIRPDDRDMHTALGLVLYRSGRHGEAIAAFDQALGLDPVARIPWLYRGLSAGKQGDWEGARQSFESGLFYLPDDPMLGRELGYSLSKLGRHQEAATKLDAAASSAPDDPVTLLYLGLVQSALGNGARAAEAYQRHQQLLRAQLDR